MTADRRNRALSLLLLIGACIGLSLLRLLFEEETLGRQLLVMGALFLAVFLIPLGSLLMMAEMLAPSEGEDA